jgi:uncharacterized protein YndB with AHSA1/START domain
MKYTLEIVINAPLEKVFSLFDNPDNLRHWQSGFVSVTHLDGGPRVVGTKSMIKSKVGGRVIDIMETVIERKSPVEFSAIYEAKGAWNDNRNYFSELASNKTKWVQENTFRCSGILK